MPLLFREDTDPWVQDVGDAQGWESQGQKPGNCRDRASLLLSSTTQSALHGFKTGNVPLRNGKPKNRPAESTLTLAWKSAQSYDKKDLFHEDYVLKSHISSAHSLSVKPHSENVHLGYPSTVKSGYLALVLLDIRYLCQGFFPKFFIQNVGGYKLD